MTATAFVWKIRDKKTGLFWNGYKDECSHPIGTRFTRGASLQGTLVEIGKAKAAGKLRGNIDDWEIVYTELEEKYHKTQPVLGALMDAQVQSKLVYVMSDLGCSYSGEASLVVGNVYANGEMTEWTAMARLGESSSWRKMKEATKKYKIEDRAYQRMQHGWYLLKDSTTILLLRTHGLFDLVISFESIKKGLTEKLGREPW